jgi:hypothetical protein
MTTDMLFLYFVKKKNCYGNNTLLCKLECVARLAIVEQYCTTIGETVFFKNMVHYTIVAMCVNSYVVALLKCPIQHSAGNTIPGLRCCNAMYHMVTVVV